MAALVDRVLQEVDAARDEIVEFAAELVRVPSVNPPGEAYQECARVLGDRLERLGCEVRYLVADDRPEHSERYPRVNVVGALAGAARSRSAAPRTRRAVVTPVSRGWPSRGISPALGSTTLSSRSRSARAGSVSATGASTGSIW